MTRNIAKPADQDVDYGNYTITNVDSGDVVIDVDIIKSICQYLTSAKIKTDQYLAKKG